MTDVGDPVQVNSKQRRYKLEQDQRKEDFKTVMNTPEGRAVMWRLLEFCGVHSSSYHMNGDINKFLMLEGRRSIGLEVEAMFAEQGLNGEEAMFKMTREAGKRQRKVEGNAD